MKLRSRRERAFREGLKRAGIWAFLALFTLSILGGIALLSVSR